MFSPNKVRFACLASCESPDFRAAPHTKACPDFSLIFCIDANRVVRCCGTLIASLGTRLVSTHAGVNHHALAVQRKFVTEDIGMTVSGLVVGPQQSAVENQTASRARGANHGVPRIVQNAH